MVNLKRDTYNFITHVVGIDSTSDNGRPLIVPISLFYLQVVKLRGQLK